MWEECCARAIVAAGGGTDDVCQVCYGYGLFTGGAGLHGGSHKVGCLTLPMSSGNTDRQIQFMMDLNSTILCCTTSYAAYLGESLKEKAYSLVGRPDDLEWEDKVVAVLEARDGTILDVVRKIKPYTLN